MVSLLSPLIISERSLKPIGGVGRKVDETSGSATVYIYLVVTSLKHTSVSHGTVMRLRADRKSYRGLEAGGGKPTRLLGLILIKCSVPYVPLIAAYASIWPG